MHGRLKVRTTEEQAERKRLEREKKLTAYQKAMAECVKRIQTKQYDMIGMKISEEILYGNGDLQTLWNFRKSTIMALHNETSEEEMIKLYSNEMTLTENCLKKNPKSYGSWYHRQWCLLRSNQMGYGEKCDQLSWSNELILCNVFLNADERNFHCWKHRYFVIDNGNLPKMKELDFTYEKICSNFSNYSAWHYRSKLIQGLYKAEQISEEIFSKEVELIENAVFTDPNDQSAWIYEKWFLIEHQRSIKLDDKLIEKHLNNILELSALENGANKWCLLRAVELMCIVDFGKYRETIYEFLNRLAEEIDLYRRNFYLDLKASIALKYDADKQTS